MVDDDNQPDLLIRAVQGDRRALEQLLWQHYDRLNRFVSQQLPVAVQGRFQAEDVLQETFVEAWQHIGSFEVQQPEGFHAWLRTIATNKLRDRLRAHKAAKRGGGRPAAQQGGADSSLADLVDLVVASVNSPSGQVARREAQRVVLVALTQLKEDYRQAISLRYLEGRSVAEVAETMQRTERSIHMLCNRALKKLREALGRSSQYLSRRH